MIRKSGIIISISGLDGVGKSTLLSHLSAKMDSVGIPAKTIQVHLGFTPRMKRLRSRFFPERSKHSSQKPERSAKKSFKAILKSEIYKYLSVLDQILTFIQIQFYKSSGKRLLVDRYYWDNWIIYLDKYGKPNFLMILLWKIITFVAGNPTLSFMLRLSPEETFQRMSAREPGRQDQTIETLRYREEMYQSLDIQNLIVIDATKSREEVFAEVWSTIEKIYSR